MICLYEKNAHPWMSVFLVTPAGFEPAITGLRTRGPRPLDEGAKAQEENFVCT